MTVARIKLVSLHYGKNQALKNITLEIPSGKMVGLLGPDGVGKSSLLSLLSGAKKIQAGQIEVLDGDMSSKAHRDKICPYCLYAAGAR